MHRLGRADADPRAREAEAFVAGELDETGCGRRGPIADAALERFGALVAAAAAPIDDVRGSAAYRRHALGVLARRTLTWAWEEHADAPDAARSTASRARSTASGRARACCTCCASGSACRAPRTPASRASAARARSTSTASSCARAWCSPGRPRAARSSPSRGSPPARSCTPVQEAFVEAGAVQCGFCTPGLIVATHDLLARNARPTDPEIREALAGNLCRCTGYEKILDAVRLGGRAAMRTVIEGCAIATVDAAGTEHATATSSSRTTGSSRSARARRRERRRPAHRRPRLPRHARARQLPPPPLPVGHARPRPAGDAVRVAGRAVSDLGAHRRRGRARRGARRAGRARALGLHDLDRPPLRLPARRGRPAGGRDRGGARARPPLPPVPRLDGPRRVRRRAAARRGRRGPRRDPRRQPRRRSTASTTRAGRDAADRARAVLAVPRHAAS